MLLWRSFAPADARGGRRATRPTPPRYKERPAHQHHQRTLLSTTPYVIPFPSRFCSLSLKRTVTLRWHRGRGLVLSYLEDVDTTHAPFLPKLRSVLPPQAACQFDVSTALGSLRQGIHERHGAAFKFCFRGSSPFRSTGSTRIEVGLGPLSVCVRAERPSIRSLAAGTGAEYAYG